MQIDEGLLRRLLEKRQEFDEKKTAFDTAKQERDEVEQEVYEHFEDNGVEGTLKLNLGEPWGVVSFRTRETFYARVIDEDAAIQHYEERAMIDEVTAPKLVKRRLHTEVREALDSGTPLPPGLDFYADRGMTVTMQKG
jgi:hypothetical protein